MLVQAVVEILEIPHGFITFCFSLPSVNFYSLIILLDCFHYCQASFLHSNTTFTLLHKIYYHPVFILFKYFFSFFVVVCLFFVLISVNSFKPKTSKYDIQSLHKSTNHNQPRLLSFPPSSNPSRFL